MDTSKDKEKVCNCVNEWRLEAIKYSKRYLIIVCDTYDYDIYPVFTDSDNFDEMRQEFSQNMHYITNIIEILEKG